MKSTTWAEITEKGIDPDWYKMQIEKWKMTPELILNNALAPSQVDIIADMKHRWRVYVIYDSGTTPVYIGQSMDAESRLMEHWKMSLRGNWNLREYLKENTPESLAWRVDVYSEYEIIRQHLWSSKQRMPTDEDVFNVWPWADVDRFEKDLIYKRNPWFNVIGKNQNAESPMPTPVPRGVYVISNAGVILD